MFVDKYGVDVIFTTAYIGNFIGSGISNLNIEIRQVLIPASVKVEIMLCYMAYLI